MTKNVIRLLVLGLLYPTPILASDALGNFISLGLGGERCLTFTTVRANRDQPIAGQNAMAFQFWIGGHLSGVNAWVPGAKNFLDSMTVDQAMISIDDWCRAHPDNSMDEAVTGFELMLMQQHGAVPPRSYAPHGS